MSSVESLGDRIYTGPNLPIPSISLQEGFLCGETVRVRDLKIGRCRVQF